jgi:hypothetical protein
LTPRTIIMSSERPVTFSMRRIERAVPGNSRGHQSGCLGN